MLTLKFSTLGLGANDKERLAWLPALDPAGRKHEANAQTPISALPRGKNDGAREGAAVLGPLRETATVPGALAPASALALALAAGAALAFSCIFLIASAFGTSLLCQQGHCLAV